MTPRRKLLAVLAFGTLLAFACFTFGNSEPTYKSQPLSYWVLENSDHPDSRPALHAIGTNAIPHLLKWMTYKPSPLRSYFLRLRNRDYKNGPPWWIPKLTGTRSKIRRAQMCPLAIYALGPAAESAIPQLVTFTKSNDSDLAADGCMTLELIGPPAIPGLLEIVRDKSLPSNTRAMAAGSVASAAHKLAPDKLLALDLAFPPEGILTPLIQNLDDTVPEIAARSAATIGALGLQPKRSVEALAHALQNSNSLVRCAAAASLGNLIELSADVDPMTVMFAEDTLSSKLTDPDQEVRRAVSKALFYLRHRISPPLR